MIIFSSKPLEQFFGGYFHQDWGSDASDWPGVVDLFKSEASQDDASEVRQELRRLLDLDMTDMETEQILYGQLGCYYTPRPDLGGPSARMWLEQVCVALAGH